MPSPIHAWEIWGCGHITDINNGATVSENGDLSRIPRLDMFRTNVKKRFGENCPRCYTTRVKQRLADIRGLLFDTSVNHEAMAVAESRLRALKLFCEGNIGLNFATNDGRFANYPPVFTNMVRHIVELEEEICASAVTDLAAAMQRRRTRILPKFLARIKMIQDEALAYGLEGNETVRLCVEEIISETSVTMGEIKREDIIEVELLKEVDEKADELRVILEQRRARTEEWLEKLKNPSF
ncbi:hypothetical protein F5Y14DRAFT_224616 [Nemania sp. NC0429]|nr:hypothetical protein F5Y14DRAFT_224616 [Nemania sp. NC0429]